VRNLADGRVEFQLQGEPAAVDRVIGHIRSGPSYARVDELLLDEMNSRFANPGRQGGKRS
jgi:acylphosphatase